MLKKPSSLSSKLSPKKSIKYRKSGTEFGMPFLTLMKPKKSRMKTFKSLKQNLQKSIKNSLDIAVLLKELEKSTYF